jgi:short-subunit dehydrogenase
MHPTNRKVYLILFSVAFNGIFKSQGVKVKLMVCKKTQSEMNKNVWKQKLLIKCKTNNFSMKDFFSFSNLLRFNAVNMKDFRSDLRATYTRHALRKLMQKDFFPSY